MRDFQYDYDGLHRLIQADRGALNGTTFTPVDPSASYVGSQAWSH